MATLSSKISPVGVEPADEAILKADVADQLTAGYSTAVHNAGTKSSGTYTPDDADGNVQRAVNGGSHTLAPPSVASNEASIVTILYENNAFAGAVTLSGFTNTAGAFTTTNGDRFIVTVQAIHDGTAARSFCSIEALQ